MSDAIMYKPPISGSRRAIPYRTLVTQVDPDSERLRHREPEYAFTRRVFYGDPDKRGAYNRLGNVYPVGSPRGTPDPLVHAALAPTVGNPVPGLYERVDA